MDEQQFRTASDKALGALKQRLIAREEDGGYEAEEQNGVLTVNFDDPPGKFVVTPNAPVKQIWISALSTSFKLEWDAKQAAFTLPKTGELLEPLVGRLITEHTGDTTFTL